MLFLLLLALQAGTSQYWFVTKLFSDSSCTKYVALKAAYMSLAACKFNTIGFTGGICYNVQGTYEMLSCETTDPEFLTPVAPLAARYFQTCSFSNPCYGTCQGSQYLYLAAATQACMPAGFVSCCSPFGGPQIFSLSIVSAKVICGSGSYQFLGFTTLDCSGSPTQYTYPSPIGYGCFRFNGGVDERASCNGDGNFYDPSVAYNPTSQPTCPPNCICGAANSLSYSPCTDCVDNWQDATTNCNEVSSACNRCRGANLVVQKVADSNVVKILSLAYAFFTCYKEMLKTTAVVCVPTALAGPEAYAACDAAGDLLALAVCAAQDVIKHEAIIAAGAYAVKKVTENLCTSTFDVCPASDVVFTASKKRNVRSSQYPAWPSNFFANVVYANYNGTQAIMQWNVSASEMRSAFVQTAVGPYATSFSSYRVCNITTQWLVTSTSCEADNTSACQPVSNDPLGFLISKLVLPSVAPETTTATVFSFSGPSSANWTMLLNGTEVAYIIYSFENATGFPKSIQVFALEDQINPVILYDFISFGITPTFDSSSPPANCSAPQRLCLDPITYLPTACPVQAAPPFSCAYSAFVPSLTQYASGFSYANGQFYIADMFAAKIFVVSTTGVSLRNYTFAGSPAGIAVTTTQIFLCVGQNVTVIDIASGAVIANLTGFSSPKAVAVDTSSSIIYIVDNNFSGNLVFLFSLQSLTFLNSFGPYGFGTGQLESPRGIAFDASSNVYVTDYLKGAVLVFDPSGTFVTSFGSQGRYAVGAYYLLTPIVWLNGFLVLGDYGNSRITITNSSGSVLQSIGVPSPIGVGADHVTGTLYVMDQQDNRVFVFNCPIGTANISTSTTAGTTTATTKSTTATAGTTSTISGTTGTTTTTTTTTTGVVSVVTSTSSVSGATETTLATSTLFSSLSTVTNAPSTFSGTTVTSAPGSSTFSGTTATTSHSETSATSATAKSTTAPLASSTTVSSTFSSTTAASVLCYSDLEQCFAQSSNVVIPIGASITVRNHVSSSGTLTVYGTLALVNGAGLTVMGITFSSTSRISLTSPSSSLVITGTAHFAGTLVIFLQTPFVLTISGSRKRDIYTGTQSVIAASYGSESGQFSNVTVTLEYEFSGCDTVQKVQQTADTTALSVQVSAFRDTSVFSCNAAGGLSAGEIAGIVIGCVAFAAIVLIPILLIKMKK